MHSVNRGIRAVFVTESRLLASDASSSDDRILAESFLQFADHYYRVQKEIELNIENI